MSIERLLILLVPLRLEPKAIDALDTRKVTRISAGSLHSLVIDQSGGALSFGANGACTCS